MARGRPTFEQLVAHAVGELSPADAARVESELEDSPRARAELERIGEVVAALRGKASEAPTAEALRRAAVGVLRAQFEVRAWLDDKRSWIARLAHDSRSLAVPAGFRGAQPSRHLAYACDIGRVDLQVGRPADASEAERRIRGRVTAPSTRPTDVALRLSDSGAVVLADECDAHGRFKLDATTGVFDLVIDLADRATRLAVLGLDVR